MKTLSLVRHASSNLDYGILEDFERILSNQGKIESKLTGLKILEMNNIPDHIISSGAERAISTACILSNELNYDKHKIIDYYEVFNNDELTNERYNTLNALENHPRYLEIQKEYKTTKPNKKIERLMNEEIDKLKQYFYDCNSIIIDIFFILFLIQTSDPAYPLNPKLSIHLFEFGDEPWDRIEQRLISKLSMKTIDTVLILLKKMVNLNRKSSFWLNIQSLILEPEQDKELPAFNQQFLRVSKFILKNTLVRDKLREFYKSQLTDSKLSYLKEYWTTYKPLYDNKIVQTINQKTNEELSEIKTFLLRNGKGYLTENISSIRTFKDSHETPRFKQLKIPFSEIMKNESYERLFNYAIHLHGKSPSIPIIDLLIKRFIQTIPDKNIEPMLETISWSPSFKKLKEINYREFQSFFVKDLTTYFKEKNPQDKDTINIYVHIHINNWNGMLLNGHPKRNYTYIPPTIFPDQSYKGLRRRNKQGSSAQCQKSRCHRLPI